MGLGTRSEEHTSELQSHSEISYAVFCLKKKKKKLEEGYVELFPGEHPGAQYLGIIYLLQGKFHEAVLYLFFFFNDTAPTEIYTLSYTLSLHDALPISELQSHSEISYAVFCL